MLLTLEQIQDIARGCARVEEHDGAFWLMRFTEKQAQAYLDIGNEDFYNKTFATSGVRLAFKTDSRSFSYDYQFARASSRRFGHFDVYVNGSLTYHFGSTGCENMAGHADISLPEGEKTVEIYFPFSYRTTISHVAIHDGAMIEGVYRPHTLICFGDSVTHGYDAIHPSLSYASQLANLLEADYINKGIGGDIYFPALLEEAECPDPDYITVAYGANDWFKCTPEEFEANCRGFFTRLTALYPKSKIFMLSTIWHCEFDTKSKLGMTGAEQNARMREICRDYPGLYYVDGGKMTPHRQEFYTDTAGHPSEACFSIYAANLYAAIQKLLNQ